MKASSKVLKDNMIFQNMSRKGNCLDNSVIENYIYYYNNRRAKQSLELCPPVNYRLKYLVA